MSTAVEIAADILEQAADLIETVGWTQNKEVRYREPSSDPKQLVTLTDSRGNERTLEPIGYCAIGAIIAVEPVRHQLRYFVRWNLMHWLERNGSLAPQERGNYINAIPNWNDQSGRTAAEVIDAMKLCAKDLRNEATPT